MCKDNTITTSWSWLGLYAVAPFVIGGLIAESLGSDLTSGQVMIVPCILLFFLNEKWLYCFSDFGFFVQRFHCKHTVSAEEIKQIDVLKTKSGTWIVIELNGAPAITSALGRRDIIYYCLRNYRKSYLIQLQWGEREQSLKLLRSCYPDQIVIFD